MEDGCYDTSVSAIINCLVSDTSNAEIETDLVKVSQTVSKVSLSSFGRNLYKLYIKMGLIITWLDKTQLLHRGDIYLLSTDKAFEFGMIVCEVSEHCSVKKYIHDVEWVILMKSGKYLMHAPLQEPMHQYLDNLIHGIIKLDQLWESASINNVLKGNVILTNYYDIGNDLQISAADPAYDMYKI